MTCQIRYSEDHSRFTLICPDGSAFEEEEIPNNGEMLFVDPDDGRRYLAVLENYADDDLQPDTVYVLAPLPTEVGDATSDEEEEQEA